MNTKSDLTAMFAHQLVSLAYIQRDGESIIANGSDATDDDLFKMGEELQRKCSKIAEGYLHSEKQNG